MIKSIIDITLFLYGFGLQLGALATNETKGNALTYVLIGAAAIHAFVWVYAIPVVMARELALWCIHRRTQNRRDYAVLYSLVTYLALAAYLYLAGIRAPLLFSRYLLGMGLVVVALLVISPRVWLLRK
jgi:hypothetical protein